VKRRAEGGVDHPTWTFLIDREGMVRYRYLGGVLEMETVLDDYAEALKRGEFLVVTPGQIRVAGRPRG
jgi:cytochrome oxidase Cu insertion factor (SCO1/SenC/PrrC family)